MNGKLTWWREPLDDVTHSHSEDGYYFVKYQGEGHELRYVAYYRPMLWAPLERLDEFALAADAQRRCQEHRDAQHAAWEANRVPA